MAAILDKNKQYNTANNIDLIIKCANKSLTKDDFIEKYGESTLKQIVDAVEVWTRYQEDTQKAAKVLYKFHTSLRDIINYNVPTLYRGINLPLKSKLLQNEIGETFLYKPAQFAESWTDNKTTAATFGEASDWKHAERGPCGLVIELKAIKDVDLLIAPMSKTHWFMQELKTLCRKKFTILK